VAEFTVTADVPEEVSVRVCVVAWFSVSLPKLRLAALTVSCGCGAAVPVPLSATIAVPPVVEVLVIVICPLAAPVAVGSNCTCSVTACAGLNVTGRLPPTIENPVPEIVAEFTVTAEVPVEVSVTACVVGEFTVTLPKLKLAALTVSCGCGAGVAVPLSATTAELPAVELLLIVICPLAAPVAVGSNCTVNVTACAGFSVAGRLPPTMENPAPEIVAELTVTGELPDELKVTASVVGVFTVTLPKFRLAALNVSCGFAAAIPEPVRDTCAVPFVADVLPIVICPIDDPAVAGSNCTCSVTACCGFNVTGRAAPRIEYPVPVTVAVFTVTGAVPVEVSVTAWVVDEFTVTLPKSRLAVLSVKPADPELPSDPSPEIEICVIGCDDEFIRVNCPV
jgi:hypothetical protein